MPQVQNHLSARSLLRRRLTQASLLPSFVGRSLSFEIQHAKIVKPGPFERDRVFAIWYSADRTRRSPGPHPRAVVSLVRGRSSPRQPPSDPPPPTSPLSTTMTMSVVRNDRLWHRLSGVSVLGRDARDGLRTMPPPPPSPWSLYPCSRSSVPVALSSSPLPAPPGPQDL